MDEKFLAAREAFFERIRIARQTPHECDWEYAVVSDIGSGAFFETCKICMDTKGVIELD
jgi:hypothetical protein